MRNRLRRMISIALAVGLIFSIQPIPSFAVEFDNADDITYSLKSGKSLTFDEDDFDEVCVDLTDEDLDYVKFKLPDEDEGILYYNYDEDEDENAEVSSSKKYYYDRSAYLSRVTFVPDKDYSGTVSIRYTGYNEDGDSYSGRVKITVKGSSSSSDTISYSISYDKDYIQFNKKDFFNYCDKVQSEDLDYVKFTLPDKKSGILYYDYSADDDDNTKVSESKKYYYDSSPYLSRVYFLPDEDFSGTVTIRYTGYDVEGDSYNGKVKITVGDSDDDSDSSSDRISYKIDSNKDTVTFDEDDFIDLCDDLKDQDLDYVKFSIPSSSKGILYYNYKNGQYSSLVTSSKKYYVDSSPYLSDVTFVPDAKFSGSVIISFEGWDVKGKSFQSEVSITVSGSASTAKAISYTGNSGSATFMKDADFNNTCKELMGNQLNYVYFSLPSASNGTLYYGYSQDGNYSAKVRPDTKYYYDGSPYLLNVSFVPVSGFSGTTTITYTGYDITGLSYSGTIQISSSSTNQTPPIDPSNLVSSTYFSDVDTSYSWAVPYIDNLYESSIISGSNSGSKKLYSPAAPVTRGDFMLILYRAMNLKTSSTASKFTDVPSGSYYYDAIMTARALGIAQGSDNYFYPNNPITREDAMVFVLRAVNITGKTIPSGDISSLSSYYDNGAISDYSKSAVAALIKAGIITGSDDNKIHPLGSLTRAQIAAIIYRVINM